ncbi:rod shape-determining protein MreD [Thermodesulfobacteriota bacterium]
MSDLLFVAGVGIPLLWIQTTSLGFLISTSYKPDLMLILVIWAALRLTLVRGLGVGLVTGIIVDLLSGAPVGLFALTYCLILVSCNYLDAMFHIDGPVGRASLVLGAMIVTGAAVLLLRWLHGPVGVGWDSLGWIALKSMITAIASVLCFPLLERAYLRYERLVGAR